MSEQIPPPDPAAASTGRSSRLALRPSLDDVDRALIALLIEEGRISNRDLAAQVGLSEVTVATRIRQLQQRRVMRVTALCDWEAAGLHLGLWVAIEIEGRPIRDVGRDIGALEGVHFALSTLGSVDMIAFVLLPAQGDAADFLSLQMAQIKGVQRVTADVVLETSKYAAGRYSLVPHFVRPPRFVSPAIPLDEVDLDIIAALSIDGRRSNRDIGRQLKVSEGTVRARLKRLEDAGILRIAAQVDPVRAGYVGASALVGVEVLGPNLTHVVEQMHQIDEVIMVVVTTGRYQLKLFIVAPTRGGLVNVIVEQIRGISGVRTTETWDVFGTAKYTGQWGRLL